MGAAPLQGEIYVSLDLYFVSFTSGQNLPTVFLPTYHKGCITLLCAHDKLYSITFMTLQYSCSYVSDNFRNFNLAVCNKIYKELKFHLWIKKKNLTQCILYQSWRSVFMVSIIYK